MIVRVRVEDFETKEELKAGRRLIRAKVREGLKEAGQRAVLPVAKRGAPAIAAQALTTKASAKGAFLTTIGPRLFDRITGLLNFGGNPRGFIYPKKKQALHLRGTNIVVASIGAVGIERGVYGIKFQQTQGRIRARYKGKHFIEKAIADATPAMEAITEAKIIEAFGTLGEP